MHVGAISVVSAEGTLHVEVGVSRVPKLLERFTVDVSAKGQAT